MTGARARDLQGAGAVPNDGQLTIVDECGSTNDEVMALARAGAGNGTAVCARLQTAGRGRRGHTWATSGGGVCLSVCLRPAVPVSYFGALPLLTTMGALQAVRETTGLGTQVGLKWPNDLVANPGAADGVPWHGDGCKLAGLLVEAGHDGTGAFAVAGIGVNLLRTSVAAARRAHDTGDPVTVSRNALDPICLEDLVDNPARLPSLETLAERIREEMVLAVGDWVTRLRAYPGLAAQGPLACVSQDYEALVPALGHEVVALTPEGALSAQGLLLGFDGWGRARVRLGDGSEVSLASEQASLRMTGRI